MAVAAMLPPSFPLDTGQGPGMLVQSVVRGAVDNMEFVLTDLQAIMGDIQSLVAHIDSVTCRSGRQSRRRRGRKHEDQARRDQQEAEESEDSRREAESRSEEEPQSSHPGPGPSSRLHSSVTQHCIQKPACVSSVRNSHSLVVPELRTQGERVGPNTGAESKSQKMSKRFSDSMLQHTGKHRPGGLAEAISKVNPCNKLSNSRFSQPNAILELHARESCAQIEGAQLSQKAHNNPCASRESDDQKQSKNQCRQTTDYSVEQWIKQGSSLSRRPIYLHHARADSSASRGEYDLETQEARLGSRADFSDGDQSRLSLEDSPLRLRYSNKSERDVNATSGSIAIVHPMVKTKPSQSPPFAKQLCADDDIDLCSRYEVNKAAIPSRDVLKIGFVGQINNNPDEYEIPVVTEAKGKEKTDKSRQKYVYNKSFVPVTPTEQNSLHTLRKRLGNLSRSNKHVSKDIVHYSSRDSLQPGLLMNHNSLPNSPKFKRSTALRVGFELDAFDTNQNRLTSRPLYARIDGSPASTRSSSSTVRKPVAHHYYYSIDSDLDSDIIPEYLNPRILTPDLDWSYLNLMGSGEVFGITRSAAVRKEYIDTGYEAPLALVKDEQGSLDSIPTVPFYHVLASKHSSPLSDENSRKKEALGGLYEEPVNSPEICAGPGSSGPDEYCGCYEALLDSILENVAGFDTFDEALEHLSSDDIWNETYINFDDQFEEDDWDVGLGPDNSQGFAIDFPLLYLESSGDGGFSDIFSNYSLDISKDISPRPISRPCVLSLSRTLAPDTGGEHSDKTKYKNKLKYTPEDKLEKNLRIFVGDQDKMQADINEEDDASVLFNGQFEEDNIISIASCSHQDYSNRSFDLTDDSKELQLNSPIKDTNVCLNMMTTSYDTSCQAVASDSPMSLCSSDAADSSPLSDRFITSSEGDDLFTSHDESYFLLSPGSPSSGALDNAKAARAFGRTRTSELTQQFLVSLREVYERHSSGNGGWISSSANEEEPRVYLNENRESSSSSALSSTDSSTITASTSTATDATLTDDNTTDNGSLQVACPHTDNSVPAEMDTGSVNDDTLTGSGYNRNVNTWTAYAMVHVQADDVSDGTASDAILNENNMLGSMYSMTSSLLDNENAENRTALF